MGYRANAILTGTSSAGEEQTRPGDRSRIPCADRNVLSNTHTSRDTGVSRMGAVCHSVLIILLGVWYFLTFYFYYFVSYTFGFVVFDLQRRGEGYIKRTYFKAVAGRA